jgi:hypothetical protein
VATEIGKIKLSAETSSSREASEPLIMSAAI